MKNWMNSASLAAAAIVLAACGDGGPAEDIEDACFIFFLKAQGEVSSLGALSDDQLLQGCECIAGEAADLFDEYQLELLLALFKAGARGDEDRIREATDAFQYGVSDKKFNDFEDASELCGYELGRRYRR